MPDIDIDYSRSCIGGVCASGSGQYNYNIDDESQPGNVGLFTHLTPPEPPGAIMSNLYSMAVGAKRANILTEMDYWQNVLSQLYRPEDEYIRYIIKQNLTGLLKEYKGTGASGDTMRDATYKPPQPVPDWMQEYLVSPLEEAEREVTRRFHGRRGKAPAKEEAMTPEDFLRPLGAQEDLSVDQLGLLGGYLGYMMAGAPTQPPFTSFGQPTARGIKGAGTFPSRSSGRQQMGKLIGRLSDWGRYFQEYMRRSQSMFPAQVSLAQRFQTATQR